MRPLAHARVEVTWVELGLKSGHVAARRWRTEGLADDLGNYSVCDVPTWEVMSIRAAGTADSVSSGEIELLPRGGRIERRDLLVGPDGFHGIPRRDRERHRDERDRRAVRRRPRLDAWVARGPDGRRGTLRAA